MTPFSFTESPVLNVLGKVSGFLPGIRKVVAVYYCNDSSEIKAKAVCDSDAYTIEDIIAAEFKDSIEELRSVSAHIKWLKDDEMPFDNVHFKKQLIIDKPRKKNQNQLEVFDEENIVVLSIGFLNQYDNNYDRLFFRFNRELSNFGVSDSSKTFTPDLRNIIGFLIYNNVKTIINSCREDLSKYISFNEHTKAIIKKINRLKEDAEKANNSFGLNIADLCKSYVAELSSNSDRFNYILTDDAINRLKAYRGDITELKPIILKAVAFADNLYFNSPETDIYISEEYLNFENIGAGTATKPQEVQLFDKYSKTIMLLDKLENAARDVVANNMNLTSANVAKACSTPITAPAVSDALKKHRGKIKTMFEKYPDRWKIIRENFKPVRNLFTPALTTEKLEKAG